MRFDVLTVLPEAVMAYLDASILGRARAASVIDTRVVDLRPFGDGRWRKLDDAPFGGGAGQVMMVGPLTRAIRETRGSAAEGARVHTILLGPAGRPFSRAVAGGLVRDFDHLILLCGRYEGVDERVRAEIDEEISLGDFVLTGGELAALAVVDAVARLLPGALGNDASNVDESFERGLLEYPQYSRPRVFESRPVPDVLLSGDHAKIRRWRLGAAIRRTAARRPELLPPPASWPADWRDASKALDKDTEGE